MGLKRILLSEPPPHPPANVDAETDAFHRGLLDYFRRLIGHFDDNTTGGGGGSDTDQGIWAGKITNVGAGPVYNAQAFTDVTITVTGAVPLDRPSGNHTTKAVNDPCIIQLINATDYGIVAFEKQVLEEACPP